MAVAILPMEVLTSSSDGGALAFHPSYRLTAKMLRQLKAIEQTTGFLRAVSLRPDWIKEVKSRTLVQEALASLQIEGNSLTLEEAFALARELPPRELRDAEREFCNYLRAFDAIDGLRGARDAALSKGDLRNLHGLLVDGVRGGRRGAGEFRREDVKVGDVADGKVHVHHHPPSWFEVEARVDDLFAWIEASKAHGKGDDDPWIHPVILAGIAQHRLVWIHPFVDGNGRTARMLTTLLLSQRGYDFKYLFQLSTYYNQVRDDYYRALRNADATGDYTEWLTYFLGGFSHQMMSIEQMARGGT
ncbi:MAG: Fic family protein [Myxococcota bacterium]